MFTAQALSLPTEFILALKFSRRELINVWLPVSGLGLVQCGGVSSVSTKLAVALFRVG
jgi:hypothetical protein